MINVVQSASQQQAVPRQQRATRDYTECAKSVLLEYILDSPTVQGLLLNRPLQNRNQMSGVQASILRTIASSNLLAHPDSIPRMAAPSSIVHHSQSPHPPMPEIPAVPRPTAARECRGTDALRSTPDSRSLARRWPGRIVPNRLISRVHILNPIVGNEEAEQVTMVRSQIGVPQK